MATVTFDRVTKSYGATVALEAISFSVSQGEFAVIVGPSGCGKSTLLRLVTGLDHPDSGRILIGGHDVVGVAPKDRGCAMVFQSYALYPHWNVFDNIAFPLRIKRRPKAEIRTQVAAIAASLRLTPHLEKRPKALSGGERQRVALGRAMAADPQIFLFDEPLSNLDAPLRAGMRAEIIARHRELGRTALYVTHDQTEALTMGDRILVMEAGRIQGDGTPRELYSNPPNRFVAQFLGRPTINLLPARVLQTEVGRVCDPYGWRLPDTLAERIAARTRDTVEFGLRPEHTTVKRADESSPWRVSAREFTGDQIHYTVAGFDTQVTATADPDRTEETDIPVGAPVGLVPQLDRALLFDVPSGERIP